MNKKSSKLGLGMIIGLVSGALAGLFLAPKSGKKLRDDVLSRAKQIRKKLEDVETEKAIQEMFDEVSETSKSWYNEAKDALSEKLAVLSESVENIDKEKYLSAVRTVIESLRGVKELSEEKLERIKKHLESDFVKLKDEEKKTATSVVKPKTKLSATKKKS